MQTNKMIETIEFGEVYNSTILTIFGDELTYNDLKVYAGSKDGTTYLKVEWNRNEETQLVRVWFDNQVVMDKKYSIHHSCDMFYHLGELEQEDDEECCERCGEIIEEECCERCGEIISFGDLVVGKFCEDSINFHYKCAINEMNDEDSNIRNFNFKKYKELKKQLCGRKFKNGDICQEVRDNNYEYCRECMEIELGMCNEDEYGTY